MAELVDLRGRDPVLAGAQVLADPSGRRARLLARSGRIVGALFCLWLAGLVLAGLGILPSGSVPLGSQLGRSAPSSLRREVDLIRPSESDPAAALAPVASSAGAKLASASAGSSANRTARGLAGAGTNRTTGSPTPPYGHRHGAQSSHGSNGGGGTTTGGGTTAGGGTTTPGGTPITGGTGKVHGRSTAPGQRTRQTAPGQTRTSAPGKSDAAPGHVNGTTTTTPTTTPGNSGSAPGHTGAHGSGSGNSH